MADHSCYPGCPECEVEAAETERVGRRVVGAWSPNRPLFGRKPDDSDLTIRDVGGPFRSTIEWLAERHTLVTNTTKPATDREYREWRESNTMSAAQYRRWAKYARN